MRTLISDHLADVLAELAGETGGAVADHVPHLADVDPDLLGVALTTVDGRTHAAGDCDVEVTIQSAAKPFVYAAALTDRGYDAVHEVVGVEPSGQAFDEISLERGTSRPRNPMINAGALATHQLLVGPGAGARARSERVLGLMQALAGRDLTVDETVMEAELEEADRNRAIAFMLRSHGVLTEPVEEVLRGYTLQGSVRVSARDLSVMGATLACGGVQPVTGERVLDADVARQTLSVMASSGMYDGSGAWLTRVGIPAKSGVSGVLVGALPGQLGFGTLSPRLDDAGNSVRGVEVLQRLSADMGMHLLHAEPYGATVLRGPGDEADDGDDGVRTYHLQGVVQFTGAETLVHRLAQDSGHPDGHVEGTAGTVVLDLERVDRVTGVGARILHEAVRRLRDAGRTVEVRDPSGVLPDPS